MEIKKQLVTIRELVDGFSNDPKTGQVRGFHGLLDIRPIYQREFIYGKEQQKAVIVTVLNHFPLNTMYWVLRDDGTYEVLDGQQRIMSLCSFIKEKSFSIEIPTVSPVPVGFGVLETNVENLANDILDYPLEVYICSGTPEEKLAWFNVINTVGEKLTPQELRNATYAGPWVSSAKAYFSRAMGKGVFAADNSGKLLEGQFIRQEYLETAITWAANAEGIDICEYMEKHQKDADASELWMYFNSVVEWVRSKFTTYRTCMRGLPWGIWYNQYQNGLLKKGAIQKSGAEIEAEIVRLLQDEELEGTNPKNIYKYIIDGSDLHLKKRQFDRKTALAMYEKQNHMCPYCMEEGNMKEYAFEEMQADHITPWSKGGKTEMSNCQMLCKKHNGSKGAKF